MTQLRTNLIAYINKLLIKTLEFYSKCYISDIHWVPAGENQNPKQNPISFGRVSEPENRGRKIKPEPETARPKTHGYPPRTRPASIFSYDKLKNY
jgi:hypothetical protein